MYLVTGGAGFIGRHLVARLLADGHPTRVFDLAAEPGIPAGPDSPEPVRGDIRDPAALQTAMAGVAVVIHLAAESSVPRSLADPAAVFAVNLNGTLNVLAAAREAGVRRVVLASSCAVYGDPGAGAVAETHPPAPLTPYAMSKLTGEQLAAMFHREYGLETVALRYFNVYGPGQSPHSAYAAAIPAVAAALRAGRPPVIHGDGEQTRDFIAVADVVRATLLAAHQPGVAGRIFNIGTGAATTINELVGQLGAILDSTVRPTHGPARPGDIRHSVAATDRATQELGFTARVPLATGLRELAAGGGP